MQCEMCGDETELYNAEIEGAMMQVCESCGSHGEIKSRVEREEKDMSESRSTTDEPESITILVDDYDDVVKEARERRGLSQGELAKELGEKKSFLHKVETGRAKPSEALAERLEQFLDVTLLEEYEAGSDTGQSSGGDEELTIGDTISIE